MLRNARGYAPTYLKLPHKTDRKILALGANQKTFSNEVEWVVTFKNDKVSDATKQTLYLFFTLDGSYIATNFTGQ